MIKFHEWILIRENQSPLDQLDKTPMVLVKPTDADAKLISPKITKENIVAKITNCTPYKVLAVTRTNPVKFARDFASLSDYKKQDDEYMKNMIFQTERANQKFNIYVIDNDSWSKFQRLNVFASTKDAGNKNVMIIMPSGGFSELPSNSNPLGVMTEFAKETLAHEAGHAMQNPVYLPQRNYKEYLSLPYEAGTRLAIYKNMMNKSKMLTLINGMIELMHFAWTYLKVDNNYVELIKYLIQNVLPDDEIGRILMIANFAANEVKNNVQQSQFYTNAMRDAGLKSFIETRKLKPDIVDSIIKKFIPSLMEAAGMDVRQLYEYFKYECEDNKEKQLYEKIRYAYPRVAMNMQNLRKNDMTPDQQQEIT